ncbi:MAG: PD40 domain-containing protein [Anaerolineae bacterium]|nr:PD40 domain-containing protein [Anaerolineae bacterium]
MECERGAWYDSPLRLTDDPITGRAIHAVTGGQGNNRPIYFNRPNFSGDGQTLFFLSDRTGLWQVYAYDLARGRVRRLTDCAHDPGRPSVDQVRPLIYYTQGNAVHCLHTGSLDERVVHVHATPAGGQFLLMDLSRDGQYLGCMEIGPYERAADGPSDFVRRFEARPLTRFWVITVDGAQAWQAHEEKRHLQHLLFCPTDPSTLMYCHEGPWDRVEQRMWLMKWDGTHIRPLRYQAHPDIRIGHEYWLEDGQRVAYAYACPALGEPQSVRVVDVASARETKITEHAYAHFIGNAAGTHIVGDDPQYVTLLDVATGATTPLAAHGQALTIANTLYHPHPAFSPDGEWIVYCRRDAAGHNDVCLVQPGELASV